MKNIQYRVGNVNSTHKAANQSQPFGRNLLSQLASTWFKRWKTVVDRFPARLIFIDRRHKSLSDAFRIERRRSTVEFCTSKKFVATPWHEGGEEYRA